MKLLYATAALTLVPTTLAAQIATIKPATVSTLSVAPASTDTSILRVGTPVPLRLVEELTTKGKMLRVGARFHMETSEPVMVGNAVVIPAGSPAMGEITEVKNKGMWGKSGHLNARILYVTVGGRQIRLSGGFDDKGVTGTAGVVGAIALLPIAGFFTTGTSAKVPAGAIVKGFLDEDVPLAMTTTVATPLQVSVPAAPVIAPTAPVAVAPKK